MELENNARELSIKNTEIALDYYKRFTVSICVASGAGIAALLSFVSAYEGIESLYFSSVLVSLWGFTVALILSGITPFFLYLSYSESGEALREQHNRRQIEKALMDQGLSKTQIEEAFPKDPKQSKRWFNHRLWGNLSRLFLVVSAIGFIIGLVYPIVRITLKGNLI